MLENMCKARYCCIHQDIGIMYINDVLHDLNFKFTIVEILIIQKWHREKQHCFNGVS